MNDPASKLPSEDDDDVDGDAEGTSIAAASIEQAALAQPVGSQIIVERFADGLTIQVPPAGLFRGTQGLFIFALVWNVVVVAISAVVLASLPVQKVKPDDSIWIPPAFMSIFLLVGIGMLLGSINMGRRRAALAVSGGTLMVIQTGLFGSKQRSWQADDVKAIGVHSSGMKVNDKPVLELQVFDKHARKFGLLAGRSNDELWWLAQELRGALGVVDDSA
jgi:hypothetical protein